MNKILSLLVTILLFSSCARSLKIVDGKAQFRSRVSLNKIQDKLDLNYSKLKSLESIYKSEFQHKEQDGNFSLKMRMLKAEKLWMSIGMYGVTGVKVLFTQDSAKMYNKLDKNYFEGTYASINQLLSVNGLKYKVIESIFLGQPLENIYTGKYKIIELNTSLLKVGKKDNKYSYNYSINPDYRLTNISLLDLKNNTEIKINYLNYTLVNEIVIPSDILIELKGKNTKSILKLKLKTSKLNQSIRMPYKVPSSYEKIPK